MATAASGRADLGRLLDESVGLHRSGAIEPARAGYVRILEIDPQHGEATGLLAVAELDLGNVEAAAQLAERAVRLAPASALHWQTLGHVRLARGDAAGAEANLQEALRRAPESAPIYVALGLARKQRGDLQAAMLCFVQAVTLDGGYAPAHLNVGLLLQEIGEPGEAAAAYEAAIRADPGSFEAYLNLSSALGTLHRFDAALAAANNALALAPDSPAALLNKGSSLAALGEYDEAAATFARVLAASPENLDAWRDLGGSLYRAGRIDEAVRAFERGLSVRPDHISTHSTYLLALNYQQEDPARLLAAHRRFGEALRPLAAAGGPARPRARERLRVGYLSPDFRRHSVAFFAAPLLERRDRSRFEAICYATSAAEDAWTARFKGWADGWVAAAALSDEALAERIRADRIDVLVDLAGHTGGGRPGVLARRAAAVQIAYLGYPSTTGIDAVDYRITDALVDPDDSVVRQVEQALRLPHSYFCYRPEGDEQVAVPPVLQNGFVTFGSFNVLAKISDATVRLWSALLSAVPRSRLLLKAQGLHVASAQRRLAERFEARGIAAERIEFVGWATSLAAHLRSYDRVDIAVDTYPYAGATTTCEALWMGVPVFSRYGATHASRMGLSILTAAGTGEWAVADESGFVAAGAGLAAAPARLVDIRAGLRDRLRGSSLMDERAHVAAFEACLFHAARGAR